MTMYDADDPVVVVEALMHALPACFTSLMAVQVLISADWAGVDEHPLHSLPLLVAVGRRAHHRAARVRASGRVGRLGEHRRRVGSRRAARRRRVRRVHGEGHARASHRAARARQHKVRPWKITVI